MQKKPNNKFKHEAPMKLELAANKAVFELQMNSKDATRFVERRSRVDEKTASQAINDVAIWYKVGRSNA